MEGKVALVTGGASGIGRAAAGRFAAQGAAVVIADRQEELGLSVVDEIAAGGGRGEFVLADVTDENDVEEMVRRCVVRFGGLHYAFNNAGITGPAAAFHDTPLDVWRSVVEVDMTSVFLCMRAELSQMTRQGGGAIVNASSQTSMSPAAGLVAYNAAKHGVIGLTQTAAVEYAGNGIRVNAVLPGATDTPMLRAGLGAMSDGRRIRTDPGGYATPDQVAATVVWLCSDEAEWISGVALLVDRGKALHLASGSPPAVSL